MALLLSTASHVAGSDIDSILIRSVGGPEVAARICSLKTISSYGKIEMGGQVGEYREFIELPDKYRAEMTFSSMTITQGFDGAVAWMQDASGAVSELSGYEERSLRIGIYLSGYGYLCPVRFPGRVALEASPDGDSSVAPVVKFIVGEGAKRDTVRASFDPVSGRLVTIESRMDHVRFSQALSDYADVRGIPFPMTVQLRIEPLQTEISVRYDSILLDQPISDSIYQWPGPPRPVLKMPPGRDSYAVTAVHYHDHVFVQARFRGHQHLWLLLDTGASGTIMDKTLFDGMIVPNIIEAPALGITGYTPVARIRASGICLGELCSSAGLVGVGNLSDLAGIAPPGQQLGGLLGFDFLYGSAVELTAADSQVTFHKHFDTLRPGQVAIPFRYTLRVPTVRAEIGNDSADFILDTGSPFEIVLFEATARHLEQQGNLQFSGGQTNSMVGIGGPVTYRKAHVSEFALGPYAKTVQPVVVTSDAPGLAGSREIAGNIGLPWLLQYNPIFDYRNMRLILDTSVVRPGNSE